MSSRRTIPGAIQQQVLVASRRRCCLCYYVRNITNERKGQIAHLSGDPSSVSFDDLVFLCLDHHDEFDSTTSQAKGLTSDEVRHYRDELYQALASGGEEADAAMAESGGKDRGVATQNGPDGGQGERPLIPWPGRPGAPQFRVSLGIHKGELLCEFEISYASPAPGGLEVRWLGAGTNMDWTTPMLGNVPSGASSQRYQMKPTAMMPTPPSDEVTLEVQFNLEDGLHGGRWTWPMRQHESKGHWTLDSHLGSGVFQPLAGDAW